MIPDGKPGRRRYGCWAGKPNGNQEDADCCIESVYSSNRYVSGQCSRRRGWGLNGDFCLQHSKKHPAISSGVSDLTKDRT